MNILNDYTQINALSKMQTATPAVENQPVKTQEYKPDILDIFSEKVVNKRDITDTVTVPRAIFKGYLCFTAGTTINAIAGMMKKSGFSKYLGIAGSLVAIYGTFNFVKPFLIKENKEKSQPNK